LAWPWSEQEKWKSVNSSRTIKKNSIAKPKTCGWNIGANRGGTSKTLDPPSNVKKTGGGPKQVSRATGDRLFRDGMIIVNGPYHEPHESISNLEIFRGDRKGKKVTLGPTQTAGLKDHRPSVKDLPWGYDWTKGKT